MTASTSATLSPPKYVRSPDLVPIVFAGAGKRNDPGELGLRRVWLVKRIRADMKVRPERPLRRLGPPVNQCRRRLEQHLAIRRQILSGVPMAPLAIVDLYHAV